MSPPGTFLHRSEVRIHVCRPIRYISVLLLPWVIVVWNRSGATYSVAMIPPPADILVRHVLAALNFSKAAARPAGAGRTPEGQTS